MTQPATRTYKRNQVEQTIVLIEEYKRTGDEPPRSVKADLKRLLDIDRNPRAKQLSWDHPHFAFYDEPPPGRGAEIGYTPYHAFALLIGCRLLQSGLPQSTVVRALREVRPELEAAFRAIMARDPAEFRPTYSPERREMVRSSGYAVQDAKDMCFLIVQGAIEGRPIIMSTDGRVHRTGNVCPNPDVLLQRLTFLSHFGQAASIVELMNPAFQITYLLERVQPRKRGPASR